MNSRRGKKGKRARKAKAKANAKAKAEDKRKSEGKGEDEGGEGEDMDQDQDRSRETISEREFMVDFIKAARGFMADKDPLFYRSMMSPKFSVAGLTAHLGGVQELRSFMAGGESNHVRPFAELIGEPMLLRFKLLLNRVCEAEPNRPIGIVNLRSSTGFAPACMILDLNRRLTHLDLRERGLIPVARPGRAVSFMATELRSHHPPSRESLDRSDRNQMGINLVETHLHACDLVASQITKLYDPMSCASWETLATCIMKSHVALYALLISTAFLPIRAFFLKDVRPVLIVVGHWLPTAAEPDYWVDELLSAGSIDTYRVGCVAYFGGAPLLGGKRDSVNEPQVIDYESTTVDGMPNSMVIYANPLMTTMDPISQMGTQTAAAMDEVAMLSSYLSIPLPIVRELLETETETETEKIKFTERLNALYDFKATSRRLRSNLATMPTSTAYEVAIKTQHLEMLTLLDSVLNYQSMPIGELKVLLNNDRVFELIDTVSVDADAEKDDTQLVRFDFQELADRLVQIDTDIRIDLFEMMTSPNDLVRTWAKNSSLQDINMIFGKMRTDGNRDIPEDAYGMHWLLTQSAAFQAKLTETPNNLIDFLIKFRDIASRHQTIASALPGLESILAICLKDNLCHVCSRWDMKLMQCNRCKSVTYCGRECQVEDWKQHKTGCFPARKIE